MPEAVRIKRFDLDLCDAELIGVLQVVWICGDCFEQGVARFCVVLCGQIRKAESAVEDHCHLALDSFELGVARVVGLCPGSKSMRAGLGMGAHVAQSLGVALGRVGAFDKRENCERAHAAWIKSYDAR